MAVSEKSWLRKDNLEFYLKGLGSDRERERWEDILLEDEQALSIYMDTLEELEDEFPELGDHLAFTNGVMKNLADRISPSVEQKLDARGTVGSRQIRWYEKQMVHYVVAASLTMVFLSSGVFDRLLTGNMEIVVESGSNPSSYSEQMMQATSGWIEQLMNDRGK